MTESDEEFFERHMAGLSRRTLIGGAIAGGTLAAFGSVLGSAESAQAATVPFPLANPWASNFIDDDFAEHLARHSDNPGIDFWSDAGTPLQAPHAGALVSTYSSQTNLAIAQITHPSGWKSQLLHLSKPLSTPNRTVVINEVVGLSGGSPGSWGAGTASGEHVHWSFCPPGLSFSPANNVDPLLYINTGAGAVPESERQKMAAFLQATDLTGTWYVVEEFEVRTITTQSVASQFNKVYGESIKVSSAVANAMIAHAQANRSSLIADIAAAVNAP